MSPLSLKTFTNNLDTNIVFPGNIVYGIRQWKVDGRERKEGEIVAKRRFRNSGKGRLGEGVTERR
jgi:hypothetical protein